MNVLKFAVKVSVIVITLGLISYSSYSGANAATSPAFNQPAENLLTGGQPSQTDLATLKAAGVTKIINLRGEGEELPYDEKAEAEALGLEYLSLPVSGADDITADNARVLDNMLQGDGKVFVHCASGNRVGALLAIGAHEVNGKPVSQSLEFGRAAGLGSLEPKVLSVLNEKAQK
jgi:uncharacterized protein (TIGR01244 family)